jgi:hypothetical protein
MLFLQDKVALEVYGNGLSTISMVIILAMLAVLGYTFMRVQAVLNKSKTF